MIVGMQEGFQTFCHFVSEHIFFHFKMQARFIIGLDDPFYRTVNRLIENGLESHSFFHVHTS